MMERSLGTVATYYCTSNRHVLVGLPKLTCRKDGTWDASVPECRLRDVPDQIIEENPIGPIRNSRFPIDRETLLQQRPIRKNKIDLADPRPVRRKPIFGPDFDPDNSPGPNFPINNEIPDSANVQANPAPNVNIPPVSPVQSEKESGIQQLNLGKKILSHRQNRRVNTKHIFFLTQVALSLSELLEASFS